MQEHIYVNWSDMAWLLYVILYDFVLSNIYQQILVTATFMRLPTRYMYIAVCTIEDLSTL